LANAGAEYAKKSESEKIRYKIRLLYDSLTRDEKELESLLGRIGNFGADQKLEKMTGMEISIKKRKIRIKKKMLSDLKRYIERQF
jgi:hypothetical protein